MTETEQKIFNNTLNALLRHTRQPLLAKIERLEAENKKLQAVVKAVEEWAVSDMNNDLLGFIKETTAMPDAESIYKALKGGGVCAEMPFQLETKNKNLKKLLDVAKCPNCDGGGGIPRQVSSRTFVTRDMAMDAGDPALEGSLYTDDEWKAVQCQWCFEKEQALKDTDQ